MAPMESNAFDIDPTAGFVHALSDCHYNASKNVVELYMRKYFQRQFYSAHKSAEIEQEKRQNLIKNDTDRKLTNLRKHLEEKAREKFLMQERRKDHKILMRELGKKQKFDEASKKITKIHQNLKRISYIKNFHLANDRAEGATPVNSHTLDANNANVSGGSVPPANKPANSANVSSLGTSTAAPFLMKSAKRTDEEEGEESPASPVPVAEKIKAANIRRREIERERQRRFKDLQEKEREREKNANENHQKIIIQAIKNLEEKNLMRDVKCEQHQKQERKKFLTDDKILRVLKKIDASPANIAKVLRFQPLETASIFDVATPAKSRMGTSSMNASVRMSNTNLMSSAILGQSTNEFVSANDRIASPEPAKETADNSAGDAKIDGKKKKTGFTHPVNESRVLKKVAETVARRRAMDLVNRRKKEEKNLKTHQIYDRYKKKKSVFVKKVSAVKQFYTCMRDVINGSLETAKLFDGYLVAANRLMSPEAETYKKIFLSSQFIPSPTRHGEMRQRREGGGRERRGGRGRRGEERTGEGDRRNVKSSLDLFFDGKKKRKKENANNRERIRKIIKNLFEDTANERDVVHTDFLHQFLRNSRGMIGILETALAKAVDDSGESSDDAKETSADAEDEFAVVAQETTPSLSSSKFNKKWREKLMALFMNLMQKQKASVATRSPSRSPSRSPRRIRTSSPSPRRAIADTPAKKHNSTNPLFLSNLYGVLDEATFLSLPERDRGERGDIHIKNLSAVSQRKRRCSCCEREFLTKQLVASTTTVSIKFWHQNWVRTSANPLIHQDFKERTSKNILHQIIDETIHFADDPNATSANETPEDERRRVNGSLAVRRQNHNSVRSVAPFTMYEKSPLCLFCSQFTNPRTFAPLPDETALLPRPTSRATTSPTISSKILVPIRLSTRTVATANNAQNLSHPHSSANNANSSTYLSPPNDSVDLPSPSSAPPTNSPWNKKTKKFLQSIKKSYVWDEETSVRERRQRLMETLRGGTADEKHQKMLETQMRELELAKKLTQETHQKNQETSNIDKLVNDLNTMRQKKKILQENKLKQKQRTIRAFEKLLLKQR